MKKISILFLALMSGVMGFTSANTLAGTSWELTSFNGTTGAVGTLSFDETMMYSKFCNNVSQEYAHTASGLVALGAGMSTMMYCEGMPMILEQAFVLSETVATPGIMSGETLTITLSGNNIFVFNRTQKLLNDLVSTCIQAYDECSNMCTRDAGTTDRACTKMGCTVKKDAQCIMSTNDIDLGREVGNDEDMHGCKGSAGYSWSQLQKQCVRVWENTGATDFELAYDFAFNEGMTTMQTVEQFRGNDLITRQEAAKILVAFAEGAFDKSYASFPEVCNKAYSDDSLFDATLKSFIYDACAHGMMKGSNGTFMPNDTLTKGQALAVLMRTADGMQSEEDTPTWWMPYVERARELALLSIGSTDDFNKPITRAQLIVWAHTIYLNVSSQ